MQTLKFKIKHEFMKEIEVHQRQYSILLHSAFEFIKNDSSKDSCFDYMKGTSSLVKHLKNLGDIELMNSWLIQCAISEAYQLNESFNFKLDSYQQKMQRKTELEQKEKLTYLEKKELRKLQKLKEPKVIFGGRNLFNQRCKNQISKKEFKQRRLSAIYSIGTAKPYKGNQKFRISEDLQYIIFQPDRKHHFELELTGVSKGYKEILRRLYNHQELKDLPITYKLTSEYVWISFEEERLYGDEFNFKKKKDRYCALDLNPNYIGYSIIDWKSSNEWRIVESGVYSFKQINDAYNEIKGTSSEDLKKKYWNNKRKHEVIEVAKNLIDKCCYYKAENFVIEDLNFKDSKQLQGSNLNRLCKNQWIRRSFINNLKKRCSIFKINFIEVLPQYSSFIGNIIFRSLVRPDMVLSSIELSRRGYEFRHQYVLKDKPQMKNIVKIDINDDVFRDLFRKSMEEFSVEESFKDVIDAYWNFKRDSKLLYRVSLDDINNINRHFGDFQSRHSRMQVVQFE